jgi:hypothetical protein
MVRMTDRAAVSGDDLPSNGKANPCPFGLGCLEQSEHVDALLHTGTAIGN